MRPLKLTLQAFGSYAGIFEVDFVRLNEHGVFTITGPTGSGKTTIFDAMVYALYGDLPGKRDADGVRSHFALATFETVVTFEFEVKGIAWTIERRPRQERPKLRSDGTTVAQSSALLRESNAFTGGITRLTEITPRIKELVGLDKQQFQQVVLLPQGEFEAVLKAETDERIKLLRQLFPVDLYRDFTVFLEEEMKCRRVAYDDAKQLTQVATDKIRQAFAAAQLNVPDDVENLWHSSLFEEETFDLGQLEQRRLELGVMIEAVTMQSMAARSRLDIARLELQQIAQIVEQFDKWQQEKQEALAFAAAEAQDIEREKELNVLQTLSGLVTTLDRHETLTGEVARLDTAAMATVAMLEQVWIAPYDIEATRSPDALVALEAKVGADRQRFILAADEHGELIELAASIDEATRVVDDQRGDLEACEAAEQADQDRIEEIEVYLKDAKPLVKGLGKLQAQLTTAIETVERLVDRATVETEFNALGKQHKTATTALTIAREHVSKLQGKYRDGLAGELAKLLVAGEACPTCGSADHPAPAKAKKSTPSSDEIDQAEADVVAATKEESLLAKAVATCEGRLSASTTDLTLAEAKKIVEELQVKEKDLSATNTTCEVLEVEVETLKASIKARAPELAKLKTTVTVAQTKLAKDREGHKTRLAKFEKSSGPIAEYAFDEDAFDRFAELLATYRADLNELAATKRDLQGVTDTLAPHLETHGVTSPKELREKLLSQEEITAQRSAVNARRNHRQQVLTSIAGYEATDHPAERPDVARAEARFAASEATFNRFFASQTQLETRASNIADDSLALGENEAFVVETRARFEEALSFYKLCAGQHAGKNEIKVSLEEWVLSVYLKRVLFQANARMDKMTSGRYSLQVNSLGGDSRKRHGLDLEVFDVFTGKSRSAKTLSGGETFMSALALALGLADVVAAGSNHELEALFIDEGFGSLDGDSLSEVLNILESLQDSGRIVGVISHVEALKEVLPRGIEVVGTDRGSKANVYYPDLKENS